MGFDQLIEFLTNKMRMSHIYQPLLIRSLVDAGGSTTLRQLAQVFLKQDESQLVYYEKRLKECASSKHLALFDLPPKLWTVRKAATTAPGGLAWFRRENVILVSSRSKRFA